MTEDGKDDLSENEKKSVEADAKVDSEDDTSREYKGSVLTDIIFAPVDLAAGTKSTTEDASDKQEYYDDLKDARDRR